MLAAEPPALTVTPAQAVEGPSGRPNPGAEEEEEERRRQRLAAVRRLALRLAGLLGAGTGITVIYIFGEPPPGMPPPDPPPPASPPASRSPLAPPPPGSNAVDEHGAKVRAARPPPVLGNAALGTNPERCEARLSPRGPPRPFYWPRSPDLGSDTVCRLPISSWFPPPPPPPPTKSLFLGLSEKSCRGLMCSPAQRGRGGEL